MAGEKTLLAKLAMIIQHRGVDTGTRAQAKGALSHCTTLAISAPPPPPPPRKKHNTDCLSATLTTRTECYRCLFVGGVH